MLETMKDVAALISLAVFIAAILVLADAAQYAAVNV